MTQTFSRVKLSGSTDGKHIQVAATATPGTTIHTAHATDLDEIHIFATNNSASTVVLTIEFGGVTTADRVVISMTAQQGHIRVIAGAMLTNAMVVKAYADTTAVVNISGYVNRIT